MLVIGIDPGTAITGYGLIYENTSGNLEIVDYGSINTPSNLPLASRLLLLHEQLNNILTKYKPINAAVEKIFFQKNVKTALNVGHARGVVFLALAEEKISIDEYTPTEIKQAVVGYGAAGKVQVQSMVKTLLHLEENPQPDDAADALAVAICHLHSSGFKELIKNEGGSK